MGNNACCGDNRPNAAESEQVFQEERLSKLQKPLETSPQPIVLPILSQKIEIVLNEKNPFAKQLSQLKNAHIHLYKQQFYYGVLDENSKPSGYGKMYKADGSIYIGQFKNGMASGKGMFVLPDGSYYQGDMEDNSAESTKGFYKSSSLEYVGGFHKNNFHGMGSQKGNQFTFEGEYENGRRKQGVFKWGLEPNQFVYEGAFDQNGKFTGRSKISDPKGIFEGDFKDGIKEGYGIYKFKTQIRYEGHYKNNQKNGRGTIINKDGTVAFSGEFLNGLPHGKGYSTDKKGVKHSIQWNEGVYAHLV